MPTRKEKLSKKCKVNLETGTGDSDSLPQAEVIKKKTVSEPPHTFGSLMIRLVLFSAEKMNSSLCFFSF